MGRTSRSTLLLLSLAVAACGPPEAGDPAGARELYRCPRCNLLLISIDTLRADHMSCYGYERSTTPGLCRFFEGKIRFERALSQSSWTAPAHASMFTSLYPTRHGVSYGPRIPKLRGQPTIFGILRDHGYTVAALHGGGYLRPVVPSEELDHEGAIELRSDLVRAFEDFRARSRGRTPFFLFLHGFDLHRSYTPRRNYFLPEDPALTKRARADGYCRYEALGDGSHRIDPASIPDDPLERRYVEALYDSELREVDASLSRLLEHLERGSVLDDTVVVLTSDHGEEFWDHGGCEHVRTVYNELLHVPLLLHVPRAPPLVRRDVVPASIGILPTLLDVLAVPSEDYAFDGWSLLGGRPRAIFAEAQFHYDGSRLARFALVEGGAKLVLDAGAGRAELYDLESDWRETRDLLPGADPMHLEDLRRRLSGYAERAAQAREGELEPGTVEELRALGYLE